ncbi:uncharacterized serine-rich protein C215.13 [Nymphaea colorata]|uniref:Uncharacterized protein n=1 Tax=Nymphaea colorata TaxID=210225 RepID=A0A5K1AJJ4_9MAGN|nr:uncharacterized serine-rich protein C215.13 [Nymphaea colorata]
MGDKDVDDGLDGMQCNSHPFTNKGGICAFCLQEKLGKLISSSTLSFDAKINNHRHIPSEPSPSHQHHSSSSSPSFTIEAGTASALAPPPLPSMPRLKQLASSSSAASAAVYSKKLPAAAPSRPSHYHLHREQTTFASSLDKKVGGAASSSTTAAASSSSSSSTGAILTLNRSRSVAPRRALDSSSCEAENSPRRRSFWSFLSFARKRGRDRGSRRRWDDKSVGFEVEEEEDVEGGAATRRKGADDALFHQQQSEKKACGIGGFEKESESPNSSGSASYFGRKVARSRSVGCGSRSFSGDFLERISNGFVDCTLRRVESHREAKANSKIVLHGTSAAAAAAAGGIKESVKCGGLFGGFGIYSASSSSYWLSEDLRDRNSGRLSSGSGAPHGRTNKGWGWAFASPMRAFRPSRHPATEKDGEEGRANNDPRSNGSGSSNNDNSRAPVPSIVTESVPPPVVLVGGY